MTRVLFVLIACAAATARAHELWIQPDDFHPPPGARVALDLVVGEACEGETLARDAGRVESFVVASPGGTRAVEGIDFRRPAGSFVAEDGVHVAAYRSRRSTVTMEADDFDAYLASSGNEDVVGWRARHGEEDEPGREVFSRCAKALLVGGAAGSGAGRSTAAGSGTGGDAADAALSWPLELVLLTPLTELTAPGELRVLLLRDGRRLKDHLVTATRCDGPASVIEAHADAQGIARLGLTAPGQWILSSVKVVRAPKGVDADWESFWASFTLDVPAETE